ncbi:MAG: hypothetical protein HY288_09425 [Planctomycetia bacterium]|nr:hypothetical protein [Planctomycetia bacterium]
MASTYATAQPSARRKVGAIMGEAILQADDFPNAFRFPLPLDWEGAPPAEPIKTLADVLAWLEPMAANVVLMREHSTAFQPDAALDAAQQLLRNVDRLSAHLAHLGEKDFPRCTANPGTLHNAEMAIVEIVRWLRSKTPGVSEKNEPEPRPVVQLRGIAQNPIVNGKIVKSLSEPRYKVIEALIAAGPDGLSKPDLESQSGKGDAVKYLRELRKLTGWKSAIKMAGGPWQRYAIVHR